MVAPPAVRLFCSSTSFIVLVGLASNFALAPCGWGKIALINRERIEPNMIDIVRVYKMHARVILRVRRNSIMRL